MDVDRRLGAELAAYLKDTGLKVTGDFSKDVANRDIADFYTAAYLALQVEGAQKPGRSPDDALKFGIGKHHGAFNILSAAQEQVKDEVGFAAVATALSAGTAAEADVVAYINQVVAMR